MVIVTFTGFRNRRIVSGAKKTPFHRLLWELFAVSPWDKASLVLMVTARVRTLDFGNFQPNAKSGPLDTFCLFFCYLYFTRDPHKGECSPD